jgi:hypothetical protein
MKTLVAALLSLGAGTVLGVAAVIGIKAAVNPDNTVNTSNQQPVDVLDYGTRS